ncbi:hypothetical protein QJS10_CPA07g00408 [Acorus calamus]|uniref:Uncharacterized protein n=1 Tax=Acorus calamus TaxID=4465 RepID=A0AAV9EE82_ACOCL|nr:hypothetical protein QJS10_CPA07g00408 [Acorus calamus]
MKIIVAAMIYNFEVEAVEGHVVEPKLAKNGFLAKVAQREVEHLKRLSKNITLCDPSFSAEKINDVYTSSTEEVMQLRRIQPTSDRTQQLEIMSDVLGTRS